MILWYQNFKIWKHFKKAITAAVSQTYIGGKLDHQRLKYTQHFIILNPLLFGIPFDHCLWNFFFNNNIETFVPTEVPRPRSKKCFFDSNIAIFDILYFHLFITRLYIIGNDISSPTNKLRNYPLIFVDLVNAQT